MQKLSTDRSIRLLASSLRRLLLHIDSNISILQELRIRINQPFIIQADGKEHIFQHIVTKEELIETLEYISQYSLYAYETELKQGFLTVEGGHRVGVSGKVAIENGKIKNFQYISSLNIRLSHEIIGCADKVLPLLVENQKLLHTLIVSPPGYGKTTILRDLVRQVSDGNRYIQGQNVCVVDERSEIGGCYQGIPQNTIGKRTDILDNCPKAEGMFLMIRSMSPKILAVDEIGTSKDVEAILYALLSGVTVLATAHGNSLEEIKQKKGIKELYENKCFRRYIIIGLDQTIGKYYKIYDEQGCELCF